jgi:26S proteasome regulatory subunit T1
MAKEDQIDSSTKKEETKDDKKKSEKEKVEKDDKGRPLTEQDIALIKRYGKGPYTDSIKKVEDDIKKFNT